jgi:hypothetical protein
MNEFRKWINRDDGKYCQVGNENLNCVEVFGYTLLICSFLVVVINKNELVHVPKWMTITVATTAIVLMWWGNYKKNKQV